MHVLALVSQKGGVSKTTSTVNLAACLAEYGKRILVVDLDPQGAATVAYGYEPDANKNMFQVLKGDLPLKDILLPTQVEGVQLAPSDIELAGAEVILASQMGWDRILRSELEQVQNEFDYCIIDGPPSLGILSQSALIAADTIVIPVKCDFLSLRALKQLMRIFQRIIQRGIKQSVDLLIFRTMYRATTKQSQRASAEIKRISGDRLLSTIIHHATDLENSIEKRIPIIVYKKNSRAASEYRALTKEVMEYVEKEN